MVTKLSRFSKPAPIDLVLSDILMPGMDGLTLLGHMRNRYPNAHIVVMTVKNTSSAHPGISASPGHRLHRQAV